MILILSVLIGLISMFAYGFANAFSKPLSQKLGAPQTLFLRGFTIIVVLGLASIPYYKNFSNWEMGLAAIALGILGYLPVLAFTHAIKESPLGVIAPIAGTSPLVTVVLSFIFLGIAIHATQWAAILLVIFANVLISFNLKNWRQSNLFKISSGIPFAVIAAAGWGLFYFFLVSVATTLGPWLSALLVEIGVTIAAGLHTLISSQKFDLSNTLNSSVIANGVLICIGTVAFTVGVRYFNVGIVAVLSNSGALIATLIGVYFFNEKLHAKEKIAAGLMIIGIAALTIL